MKTWVKILLVALAFGTLLLLWSFFKSDEQYKLLESQAYNLIGSDFAKDQRTEFCYDIGDRIVAVHEMGFDAEKCASLTPKQFEFALYNVQSCEMSCINNSMDDTSRRLCNAACFAREFERDPITTQTALPLIMT
mgnify:CR=1 FL=1